jgi:hypothetical protein
MAGRFSYSRPERRGLNDPWFRIGEVDIGSAGLLAALAAISIVVYGVEPPDKPILSRLALIPDEVLSGQVWRLVTWPLANGFDTSLLWTAVAVALLWVFGNRLEEQIGRVRMAVLLGAMIVIPGILGTLLDLPQYGIRSIELAVLLIFVAEYPQVRFFFGIPAWVLGLVLVVTDILQLSGNRANRQLLFYLLSLVVAALGARAVGMFSAYPWIPRFPLPSGLTGIRPSGPTRSAKGRTRGGKGRKLRSSGNQVIDGPWSPTPPPPRPGPDVAAAQAELDGLLDKISAGGLESLTPAEKKRLNELSKRLR